MIIKLRLTLFMLFTSLFLLIRHFARPDLLRLFRSIVRVVAFSDSTAITSVGIVVVVGAEENWRLRVLVVGLVALIVGWVIGVLGFLEFVLQFSVAVDKCTADNNKDDDQDAEDSDASVENGVVCRGIRSFRFSCVWSFRLKWETFKSVNYLRLPHIISH